MEFKNYCIVVMGYTDGVLNEINKISEKVLGNLNVIGLTITTFTSVADIKELNQFFKEYKRNFLLFIIDDNVSAHNFLSKYQHIENELFGKTLKTNELTNLSNKLVNDLKNNKIDKLTDKESKLSIEEIQSLNEEEKNKKITELIEKGYQNLDDYDKDILDKLSK